MRLSPTLSAYLARHFLLSVLTIFVVLTCLVYLLDFIELVRRGSGKEGISFRILLLMGIYKLPSLTEQMLPFAALFGAMLSLSRLSATSELIVARASGVSAWQFLMPPLVISLLLGAFFVALYNPVSAALFTQYTKLEAKYIKGKSRLLSVTDKNGLWLREVGPAGHTVIHADYVSQSGTDLAGVILFVYEGRDTFRSRIDGETARLRSGYWEFANVSISGPNQPPIVKPTYELETSLTLNQILESLAPPRTLSFWELPKFIRTLEASGFSAQEHRLHWHATLSSPLLLCAMVLIAATFSLRFNRRIGGVGYMLFGGMLAGFLFFFLTDIVHALGISGKIPTALAGWAPATIGGLLGIATLFHIEDG